MQKEKQERRKNWPVVVPGIGNWKYFPLHTQRNLVKTQYSRRYKIRGNVSSCQIVLSSPAQTFHQNELKNIKNIHEKKEMNKNKLNGLNEDLTFCSLTL